MGTEQFLQRPLAVIVCIAGIIALPACQKDQVGPGAQPVNGDPTAHANLLLNGQTLTLTQWCGGAMTRSGTVNVFTGTVCINEGSDRWTLVFSTALDESVQLPVTWDVQTSGPNAVVSLTHWPNYPTQAGLEMYSTHDSIMGSIAITRMDPFAGGSVQGTFTLENLEHGDVDTGNMTLSHSLSGDFNIEVRTVQ